MNTPVALFALLLLALGAHAASPQLRYINPLPQFGDSNFTVAIPFATLFTGVGPSTVTPYAAAPTGSWNFFSSYARLVYAGSDQFSTSSDGWYTVFTYQNGANQLKNLLVEDQSTPPSGDRAAIRVLNLSQFNYSINATATNSTNSTVLAWNQVGYASASAYSNVAAGVYYFDWSSATLSKRNVLQNNCTPGTPGCNTPHVIRAGESYTYVVMPAAEPVVVDGATSKRSVRRRKVSKTKALVEKLTNKGREEEETPEKVESREARGDGMESSEGGSDEQLGK